MVCVLDRLTFTWFINFNLPAGFKGVVIPDLSYYVVIPEIVIQQFSCFYSKKGFAVKKHFLCDGIYYFVYIPFHGVMPSPCPFGNNVDSVASFTFAIRKLTTKGPGVPAWTWLQAATNRLPQSGAYAIKLERESQKTATVDRDYLSRDYVVDQHTHILPERLLPVNPKRRTSHSLPLPGPV